MRRRFLLFAATVLLVVIGGGFASVRMQSEVPRQRVEFFRASPGIAEHGIAQYRVRKVLDPERSTQWLYIDLRNADGATTGQITDISIGPKGRDRKTVVIERNGRTITNRFSFSERTYELIVDNTVVANSAMSEAVSVAAAEEYREELELAGRIILEVGRLLQEKVGQEEPSGSSGLVASVSSAFSSFVSALPLGTVALCAAAPQFDPECEGEEHAGEGFALARSVACQEATDDAHAECGWNEFCIGCCWLADECDCICLFGDFDCFCSRRGRECSGYPWGTQPLEDGLEHQLQDDEVGPRDFTRMMPSEGPDRR